MQRMHDQLGRSCAICAPSLDYGRARLYADSPWSTSTYLSPMFAYNHLQQPHAMVEVCLTWSFDSRQSRLCISYHFIPVEDRLLAKLPLRRLRPLLVHSWMEMLGTKTIIDFVPDESIEPTWPIHSGQPVFVEYCPWILMIISLFCARMSTSLKASGKVRRGATRILRFCLARSLLTMVHTAWTFEAECTFLTTTQS